MYTDLFLRYINGVEVSQDRLGALNQINIFKTEVW